ncbi:MAG: peptidoglycan bridge formation glycyltransferase FemA/FemB family protein [Anaerolineae bacterium]
MQLHAQAIQDRTTWNTTLALLPYAHVLQTWEWGDFKAATTGWRPERIAYMHRGVVVAMAQVLTRQELGLKIMYVPKGPALDYSDRELRESVLREIRRHAEQAGAIFIKIDPDIPVGWGDPTEPGASEDPLGKLVQAEWAAAGLRFSPDQVQFRNSVIVDLRRSEDDLLAAMKQKTRYNVRLGPEKKNLAIRMGGLDDLDVLYDLYAETALRDGFIIRPLDYYRRAWGDFIRAGLAQPFIAEYKGDPIAHVIVFGFGKRAWYFYGASSDRERHRMPNYALQWAAMRWARMQGMAFYDFWGAPDDFDDPDDPLAGVYRFKAGFGGVVVRRIGAWDYPARERLYTFYTRVMPAVLGVMRSVGRLRLRRRTGHSSE